TGDGRIQSAAGNDQQREAGTGLLVADANGSFFVNARRPRLLGEYGRRRRHRRRGDARRQYVAPDLIDHRTVLPHSIADPASIKLKEMSREDLILKSIIKSALADLIMRLEGRGWDHSDLICGGSRRARMSFEARASREHLTMRMRALLTMRPNWSKPTRWSR